MMDGDCRAIRFPHEAPPEQGAVVQVSDDILWFRIPLPMVLDHVNVYALRDDDGWTIVDTGFATEKSKAVWTMLEQGPLSGRPIHRVVVTHHHPDHIGLAGWFQARGAELVTTRTSWLYARMLLLDVEERPAAEAIDFYRSAGMDPKLLARRASERPFNSADVVAPLPRGFTRIRDGQTIVMGGRDWMVRTGNGHAPEQATFWCMSEPIILGADQLLPGISANIGVYPTEPNADPLSEWLESCRKFATLATEDQLVLPGHKLPFTGLPLRLRQMIENHEHGLERLVEHLSEPKVASDCFRPLFKRQIDDATYGLALVETVAHLNYLLGTRAVIRWRTRDGRWMWQKA